MLCLVEIQGAFCYGASLKTDAAHRGIKPLYEALKTQYQMVAFSPEDPVISAWWLRKEYLTDWSLVKTWDRLVFNNYHEWVEYETAQFLASGWEIGLYVDTSADAIARIKGQSIPTMQLSFPARGPGFFDPDRAPRPWATVGTDPGGDQHGRG